MQGVAWDKDVRASRDDANRRRGMRMNTSRDAGVERHVCGGGCMYTMVYMAVPVMSVDIRTWYRERYTKVARDAHAYACTKHSGGARGCRTSSRSANECSGHGHGHMDAMRLRGGVRETGPWPQCSAVCGVNRRAAGCNVNAARMVAYGCGVQDGTSPQQDADGLR